MLTRVSCGSDGFKKTASSCQQAAGRDGKDVGDHRTEDIIEVSGFSVQASAFVFILPDTRNLTPDT
jgi:hypothetical protein